MKKPNLVAGLELSSREFTAAVAEIVSPGRMVVQALESLPAQGFEREGLSDPIECADGIARLMRQLERSAGCRVSSVTAAFPSNHLKSYNASATVPVPDPAAGITARDVERAVTTCRTLSLDYDRQALHTFERGFVVDGQPGIRNPVGLTGKKLGVELHLVTALNTSAQNLERVLNRGGLEVEGYVLPALACAETVLSDLDRDVGVTLIRIGEFQTEVALFGGGQVRETFLLPGGTEDLIDRLSRSLRLTRASAEHLLGQIQGLEERTERAALPVKPGQGGSARAFPQGEVVQILRARARELLHRDRRRLVTSATFLDSTSGVVMVGHLPRLEGFLEMAEEHFNMPVRLGTAREIEVASELTIRSRDLTVLGLLRFSARRREEVSPSALPGWLRPLESFHRLLQDYF